MILAAAALTVLATTAFHSGNSTNASPPKSTGTSATEASAAESSETNDQATPTAVRTAAAEAGQPHHVVLVVGDSLIGQAEEQLREDSTPSFSVTTAYELGSAPCDWTNGRFDAELDAVHPDIVVLAFVGNAGASPGCVSTTHAFPLTELLSNYHLNMTALANRATAAGAKVIIVTPPARNPAAPAPPDIPTIGELAAPDAFYGYQGTPEIRDLYKEMTNASGGRWHLTDAAALAISPGFVYKQFLSCNAGDGSCPDGFVAVRKGHDDAIHLDADGNGAKRYAKALVASVVAITNKSAGA
ncbi:MAG: lipoprotein [Mycobacterium sp.]|nr:lipoprotein [Mycobacterium sp.]